MIISDMRHHSLFQNAAFSGQNKVSDSARGAPKLQSEETRVSRASSDSAPRVPQENPLTRLVTRVDILKESLDKILTHFPPFFPIGTYQRMDWVMEIKGIQDEIVQMSAEREDLPPFAPAEDLRETSSDEEIMGAVQGVFQFRAEAGELVKKQAEAAPLSIKI
jgi:hypothetical protein